MFVSCQQTSAAQEVAKPWEAHGLKASAPPFNVGEHTKPFVKDAYDVPAYGVRIPNAVYDLFQRDTALRKAAQELKMPLPTRGFDVFVQGRVSTRVETLVQAASPKLAARLRLFTEPLKELSPDTIKSWDDWVAFVRRCKVPDDWVRHLHVNDVLIKVFGATTQESERLLSTLRKEVTWVSKCLCTYKTLGCMTDVVNLIAATTGRSSTATKLTEDQVVAMVDEFVVSANTARWIPQALLHDAEMDDKLCWILLHALQPNLQVMVQLPPDCKDLEQGFVSRGARVFFDKESLNANAIRKAW